MKGILIQIICVIALLTTLVSFAPLCRRQGIKGHVVRISGNQMPSPDRPLPGPQPIATTLYIYALTSLSQVQQVGQSPYYRAIQTQLVKQVHSDSKGYFKVRLAPGRYSVFIKKEDLFYANYFDDQQHIAPVEVKAGTFTELQVRADYDAVY